MKKSNLKLLITAMLIFILSAQPIFAEGVSENELQADDASVNELQADDASENELQIESGEMNGRNEVKAFVNRLYSLALNREADEAGLNDWVDQLMSKRKTGNDVAAGFFFSQELEMRNVSDGEFVELLYKVMMNRDSDPSGKAYWLNMLNNGVSRRGIFNGFAGSKEFENICNSYGIDRGTTTATEGRDKNYGVTLFVARLYTQALGRNYDIAGLNDWCDRIADGTWSEKEVATTGFFESPEFLAKNLNNEEYIKVLYRTFLGREYDEQGLADWVGQLNSGRKTRTEVIAGFADSVEFAQIIANPTAPQVTQQTTPEPEITQTTPEPEITQPNPDTDRNDEDRIGQGTGENSITAEIPGTGAVEEDPIIGYSHCWCGATFPIYKNSGYDPDFIAHLAQHAFNGEGTQYGNTVYN